MSARGDSCPVQILRSPEMRSREFEVVDFGLDAVATAPASPVVTRSLQSFSLPPSPPYTNPHLRRAIPLPQFEEIACWTKSDSMERVKDGDRRMLSSDYGPTSLLSPPYSPLRRALSLTAVDEKEMEPAPPSSAAIPSAESDEDKWGEADDDLNESEPPILKLKDLDLGEEIDDWDEPLFLNAPADLHGQDSLSLNLFGAVYSSDDESQSYESFVPPSSPTVRSSSLPDLDGDRCGKSKPLFDPSLFDVFENGWDTITDSNQSSLLTSNGNASDQDTVFSPCCDHSKSFHDSMKSSALPAPSSPSRRSIVDLPTDDHSDPSMSESLPRSRPFIISEDDDLFSGDDKLFGHSRSPQSTLGCSRKFQPFDVPNEVVQTPFNISLLLPSISRAPPADSLLFAALEPQDIPLPDSPQSPVLSLQGDYVVPSLMLEECRIRQLHQEMLRMEAEARTKEALLMEHIARLNAMKSPSLPIQVPVYCSNRQREAGGYNPIVTNEELLTVLEPLHLEERQSPLSASLSYTQPCSSSHASVTLDFLQARRRELQNAVALRAQERRRRKLVKQRIRELDALLQLKTVQLCSPDAWTREAPRGRRGRNDEVTALAASGSDRHLAHTNEMLFEGVHGPETSQRDGIMQLVAKMVFRRRDTSRPLSGKNMPVVRKYVLSGLSKAVNVEDDEETNDTNITEPS